MLYWYVVMYLEQTTAALIAQYNALTERKFNGGRLDGGYTKRCLKINAIVDLLLQRADNGDSEALDFFEN